jgi:hypothetical protein
MCFKLRRKRLTVIVEEALMKFHKLFICVKTPVLQYLVKEVFVAI